MNESTLERVRRKQDLLLESAALRHTLAAQLQATAPAFAVADGMRAGWRWLIAHPLVPVAAGVALLVARPRRAFGVARVAWLGWQAWQRVQPRLSPWLARMAGP